MENSFLVLFNFLNKEYYFYKNNINNNGVK